MLVGSLPSHDVPNGAYGGEFRGGRSEDKGKGALRAVFGIQKKALSGQEQARLSDGHGDDLCQGGEKGGTFADAGRSEEINACSFKQTIDTSEGKQDYLIMFKTKRTTTRRKSNLSAGGDLSRRRYSRSAVGAQLCVIRQCASPDAEIPGRASKIRWNTSCPAQADREAAAGYSSYGNQIGLATEL